MSSPPTASDFNAWRAVYPTMPDEARREWDAWCYEHYPEQAHGSLTGIEEAIVDADISTHAPSIRVVEVGGWRGDHAQAMLRKHPEIASWTNFEFCSQAAYTSKVDDPRYSVVVPDSFRWWKDYSIPRADILILSHVIEHLSPEDLEGLLECAKEVRLVYAEAPLPENGTDWSGYLGTHILPWGWREVTDAFVRAGWTGPVRYLDAGAHLYSRPA